MYVTVVNAQQMSHANDLKQKIQLQARALKTRARDRKHEARRIVSSAACPQKDAMQLFHQFNISNIDISVILSKINHVVQYMH